MPSRPKRSRTPAEPAATVEISESGSGGSIEYREGAHSVRFEWEFAMPPALALIFGTAAKLWDTQYPWAAGRQEEIYDFVGREVLSRRASDSVIHADLHSGVMTVLQPRGADSMADEALELPRRARGAKHTPAYRRFSATMRASWETWPDGETYDLAAIPAMKPGERRQIVQKLTERDVTWREVEVLAAIDTPAARSAVEAALADHLSIDTRLAAAEALYARKRMPDLDAFLARQIRKLDRPANGLQRTLRLAARHPSATVKQALLWASYNCTESASHCAALLLSLSGIDEAALDAKALQMLQELGLHNSSFTRQAAFKELCRLVGLELDYEAAD
jgi:hypothetical protein